MLIKNEFFSDEKELINKPLEWLGRLIFEISRQSPLSFFDIFLMLVAFLAWPAFFPIGFLRSTEVLMHPLCLFYFSLPYAILRRFSPYLRTYVLLVTVLTYHRIGK